MGDSIDSGHFFFEELNQSLRGGRPSSATFKLTNEESERGFTLRLSDVPDEIKYGRSFNDPSLQGKPLEPELAASVMDRFFERRGGKSEFIGLAVYNREFDVMIKPDRLPDGFGGIGGVLNFVLRFGGGRR